MDRQPCRLSDCRDKVGEEQKGGRKMTVRHVDMQDVGMRSDADQFVAESKQISRPYRELGDQSPRGQVVNPRGRRSQHQAYSPRKSASAPRNSRTYCALSFDLAVTSSS